MKTLKLVVFLILSTFAVASFASPTYQIGIKQAKPFAYKEDGVWKGLSVDLIKNLSTRLHFKYAFVEGKSVTDLIDMTQQKKVDMSIAAISTTSDREKIIDFSQPYFSTQQGILVKQHSGIFWWVAKRVLLGMLGLVVLMYVIGFLVARADPADSIDNVHKGAWFALVTFTTTGYGDYVPANARSKVLAAAWMIASMFLLSVFTGYIASSLTVKVLTDEPTTIQSLYSAHTVTIKGSTSQGSLTDLGVPYKVIDNVQEGLALINNGKANALVYDKAMLDFAAFSSENRFTVWPMNRGHERYAIAFPLGSKLRKDFDIELLKVINSPSWKKTSMKYFGK